MRRVRHPDSNGGDVQVSRAYISREGGKKRRTWLVNMPNFERPASSFASCCPKFEDSAECIVTLPAPPVAAYDLPSG